MKKLALLSVFLALPLLMGGCKVVNAPLPAGAINAVDAGLNENLQAAHAGLVQYQSDVAKGLHTPTPAETVVVNKVIVSLNTADMLYQSFHTALLANPNAGEPADLTAAVTAVSTNLTALQTLANGGN